MKSATYTLLDGSKRAIDYDENAPCVQCGLPVIEASVGGTAVCPWCDMGIYRDGCHWQWRVTEAGLTPRFHKDGGCYFHGPLDQRHLTHSKEKRVKNC